MAGDDPGPASKQVPGPEIELGRTVGIGCFALFIGVVTGGMVGVLVGRIVESLRKAPSCEGIPICNWVSWWAVGAALGAVTLPALVLRRLRRRASGD